MVELARFDGYYLCQSSALMSLRIGGLLRRSDLVGVVESLREERKVSVARMEYCEGRELDSRGSRSRDNSIMIVDANLFSVQQGEQVTAP